MKQFKIIFILTLLLFFSTSVYSQTQLYIFGKATFTNSSGSEADYKQDKNDFPVASSYSNFGLGLGFTKTKGPFFFGLELHYNLNGKTTLTDTSDNDKVEIDTYKYATGLIILGYNIFKNATTQFYVNGGGGVSYALDADLKVYTSQYGYETEVTPPDPKYPLTAFGGIGVVLNFSSSGSLMLSGRYQYIGQEQSQTAFVVLTGVVFSF